LISCGQIYGPGLSRHDPKKARRGLGPGWATVFRLRAGTARPKNLLGFAGPNPFDTKHDGLGSGWPSPAQFPALLPPLPASPTMPRNPTPPKPPPSPIYFPISSCLCLREHASARSNRTMSWSLAAHRRIVLRSKVRRPLFLSLPAFFFLFSCAAPTGHGALVLLSGARLASHDANSRGQQTSIEAIGRAPLPSTGAAARS
jgi:hypothetical protein